MRLLLRYIANIMIQQQQRCVKQQRYRPVAIITIIIIIISLTTFSSFLIVHHNNNYDDDDVTNNNKYYHYENDAEDYREEEIQDEGIIDDDVTQPATTNGATTPYSSEQIHFQFVRRRRSIERAARRDERRRVTTTSGSSSSSSCIQYYHVSTQESNTCTNSDQFPKEWSSSSLHRYMFYNTSTQCCNDMLYPYNTFGESIVISLGAPMECNVIDACSYSYNIGMQNKYYPDLESGTCFNDGKEGEYQPNLYDTREDCCNFPWLDTEVCLSTHSPTVKPTAAVTTQHPTTSPSPPPSPSPSMEEKEQTTTTTTTSSTATSTIIMKFYPDMKNGVCIETDAGDDAGGQSFDTLEGCCNTFKPLSDAIDFAERCRLQSSLITTPNAQVANDDGGGSVTNDSNPTTSEETTCNNKWHISTDVNSPYTCTNDNDFPPSWEETVKREHFLFDTAQSCCDTNFNNNDDAECILINICPVGGATAPPTTQGPTVAGPTKIPTRRPVIDAQWYIDRTSGKCVQDCEGPSPCGGRTRPDWELPYQTADLCCASQPWVTNCEATPNPTEPQPPTNVPTRRPSNAPTGLPTDHPTSVPTHTPPTKTPTHTPTIDCSSYKWHMSTQPDDEAGTCTNDEDYPKEWNGNAYFEHDTFETCCQIFSGITCIRRDWCEEVNQAKIDEAEKVAEEEALANDGSDRGGNDGGGDVTVSMNGSTDDFEGGGSISWNVGDPPEWQIDNTMAYSGTSSITNIPSPDVSATRSLTTKINLSSSVGYISCKIKVDVAMPFDYFSFHVNGEQRTTYFKREEGWTTLESNLPVGESTLEFRVTTGDMLPPFDRNEQVEAYGSGRVWIDDCEITVN